MNLIELQRVYNDALEEQFRMVERLTELQKSKAKLNGSFTEIKRLHQTIEDNKSFCRTLDNQISKCLTQK